MTLFLSRYRLPALLGTLALIAVVTWLAPLEKTLGAGIRLVYFHGAWVETGKAAYALSGLAGLAGLLRLGPRKDAGPAWSLALGRTALVFWLTYLPLSLYLQQLEWGGIYWDEPRWRVPLAFGVAAVLVQAALTLINRPLVTSAANLVFGTALWLVLANLQNVLHPDSPIFSSGSLAMEGFFVAILLLSLLCMAQIAYMIYRTPPLTPPRSGEGKFPQ
jgi:hypothetical protein